MDKDEIIAFLRENMTIEIDRDVSYYSYPHIEVKLKICDELISSSQCTIYDGEHRGN